MTTRSRGRCAGSGPRTGLRRVKVVTITALGEKAKAKAREQLYDPPAAFVNALTENEQRTLRDLLRKVRDSNSRR